MRKLTTKAIEGNVLHVGKRKAKSGSWAHEVTIGSRKFSLFSDEEFFPFRPGDIVKFDYQTRKLRSGSRSKYFAIVPDTVELLDASADDAETAGYVYVMSNKAMPGLVKIGFTVKTPTERASELSYATGVPTPFIVEASVYIRGNPELIEKACHTDLHSERKGKEFFAVAVDRAEQLIKDKYEDIYPDSFAEQYEASQKRDVEFEAERSAAIAKMREEKRRKEYESTPEYKWKNDGLLYVVLADFDSIPGKARVDDLGNIRGIDDDRSLLKKLFSLEELDDWLQVEIVGRAKYWSRGEMPWRVMITGASQGERLHMSTANDRIGDKPTLEHALAMAKRVISKLKMSNHRITAEISTELIMDPELRASEAVTVRHGQYMVRRESLSKLKLRGDPRTANTVDANRDDCCGEVAKGKGEIRPLS